jgi:hypothetical protein
MNKNENMKKLAVSIAFVVWSVIVLSAFYITQRPLAFKVVNGMAATLWTITLTMSLLFNSAGIGYFILRRIQPQLSPHECLILGTGFGLGILGLLGYGLGAVGMASAATLAIILLGIMFCIFILRIHSTILSDFQSLINSFQKSRIDIPAWLPFTVLLSGLLGFLFALLPPVEGFDGLSYHLRLPEQLLADGRILPYNILQFWFPSLLEGNFLWALGLQSERTAQLIHWSFSILVLFLIWEWASQVFGSKSAWWALAVLISMPSLVWLSAWAYTDLALTFYGLAGLYTLWRWQDSEKHEWLSISGLFAGMAMGIKYTSFLLPVSCILLIIFYDKSWNTRIRSGIKYAVPAFFVASPWYLRNWLIMGNPFYPFVFGGRYWDSVLAGWLSNAGSGIGWVLHEILLLPFSITLGYRDQNYFDGRLGPLFLLLLPITLWILWIKRSSLAGRERSALFMIGTFTLLNCFFWALSVIQTIGLWQSRLLFPGLIPYAIFIGYGIANLDDTNLPRFRISFIATTLIGIVIGITLFDNSLSLIARRPLTYALGIESRRAYFERIQPQYAEALDLVGNTPSNAYVYFLYEPRSYNMPHKVQPDPINNNLQHDFYLYREAVAVINSWKARGYTHVLVFNHSKDGEFSALMKQILPYLKLAGENNNYKLYYIQP